MCYFLYGGINEEVKQGDIKKLTNKSGLFFSPTTAKKIKKGIEDCDGTFVLTKGHCDCDTAIGRKDTSSNQIQNFALYLNELRKLKNIKTLWISKNWWKETTKKELTFHIDDINIVQLLADLEDDCLYAIQLFKKY